MIPLTDLPQAPTPREARHHLASYFQAREAAGEIRPFVLPHALYGYLFVGFYLLIPHKNRPWVYRARWLVFAATCWWNINLIGHTRAVEPAPSFVTGLLCVYGCLWAWKWLLVEKPQWEGRRVQPRRGCTELKEAVPSDEHADGQDGTELYWQSYPDSLQDRRDWLGDLLVNCRYPGWNYAIPSLPSLPPTVLAKLGEPITEASKKNVSYVGLRRFETREALFKHCFGKLLMYYFAADAMRTFMMHDPYFIMGPNDFPLPAHLARLPPRLLIFQRQVVCCLSIIIGLDMSFAMAPLLFCIPPLCLPQIFSYDLRRQPYYFPTHWGSFTYILDRGLSGVWGGFWHHTFRSIFTAPTDYLIQHGYVVSRSTAAKLSSLFFAFSISGLIHAGGSISQLPPTNPLHPIVFFALQGVGMFLQSLASQILKAPIRRMPRWVRRATNLLFVFWWGYMTSNWLNDDFSRGALWLHEQVPVSPLRGLGFGHKDEGWWCWGHLSLRWHTGRHWWESGIKI